MYWHGIKNAYSGGVEWVLCHGKDELVFGDDFSGVTTGWLRQVNTGRGRTGILRTEEVVCKISDNGKASLFEKHIAVLRHC